LDPDHWRALGQSEELREEWRAAAVAYERGAEAGGDPCSFLERQVACLQRLEEWAGAQDVSSRALALCPDGEWPYLQLGNLRRQQGDDAGALVWYKQAEARWPQDVNPKYYIGLSLYEQGDHEQAKAYFCRALAVEPWHEASMYYLAWCFYRSADMEQAVATLANAIEVHGSEPWHWAVTLGDWQLERGAWEEAVTAYQQALAWRPSEATIQQRLRSAMSSRQ
jgi:tetratricopeptide (TPR) repeat protein